MLKVSWHAFSKQENFLQLHENVLKNGCETSKRHVLNDGILDETCARLGT